ncbi:MAG: protoporphyrinogen oxidase HemJ [Pseudobdellovibrionaceae bacterium]
MQDFLLTHYLSLKALHVISIIAWMAGMFYLPRLFAYHAESTYGSEQELTFRVMERRLLRIIINPAMIASWLFGGLMIVANPTLMDGGWLHVKLTCVIVLSALHGLFARWRKQLEKAPSTHSAKFYKIWNEVPTVLMVIIVFMVILKPF